MSTLLLTPASIDYLTRFILAAAIAGYFWHLARRSRQRQNDALPTLLLAGAFTSFACATLLLFLNISLTPDLRFYAMLRIPMKSSTSAGHAVHLSERSDARSLSDLGTVKE